MEEEVSNGFREYKRLFLHNLETVRELNREVHALRTDMEVMKVRVTVIATVAAIVADTVLSDVLKAVIGSIIK